MVTPLNAALLPTSCTAVSRLPPLIVPLSTVMLLPGAPSSTGCPTTLVVSCLPFRSMITSLSAGMVTVSFNVISPASRTLSPRVSAAVRLSSSFTSAMLVRRFCPAI